MESRSGRAFKFQTRAFCKQHDIESLASLELITKRMFGSKLVGPNKADSFILFIHACLKFWLSLISLCNTSKLFYNSAKLSSDGLYVHSSAIKTKAKFLKDFLAGEWTYNEEEDHQRVHERLPLPQRREVTVGDGTGNSPTVKAGLPWKLVSSQDGGVSAEGQCRAPHEYYQLTSKLSAIAASRPHSDGVAKVAGGRGDIALDAFYPRGGTGGSFIKE
ncbi:hypothetical protein ARMGADRAFT_1147395 [Armillaria gallica]|uniref:Uncharacterized protein n=1 Tax=Armillaria gallica TaxID=47427 RepID=A0A2H3CCE4_ARMGA|nr:hypothetical protein ARMGADRAFT_1147395 [Armillaria gallica]